MLFALRSIAENYKHIIKSKRKIIMIIIMVHNQLGNSKEFL